MKPETVLTSFLRPFDGRVQYHERYSEKQQTADEKDDDHGFTEIDEDTSRLK